MSISRYLGCFLAALAATVGEEDSQQKLLAQAELTKQKMSDILKTLNI